MKVSKIWGVVASCYFVWHFLLDALCLVKPMQAEFVCSVQDDSESKVAKTKIDAT